MLARPKRKHFTKKKLLREGFVLYYRSDRSSRHCFGSDWHKGLSCSFDLDESNPQICSTCNGAINKNMYLLQPLEDILNDFQTGGTKHFYDIIIPGVLVLLKANTNGDGIYCLQFLKWDTHHQILEQLREFPLIGRDKMHCTL
jgi:hypothetical protein